MADKRRLAYSMEAYSMDEIQSEVLESCMKELREAIREDLMELYTILTKRIIAYMNFTRESFKREFIEGLKESLKVRGILSDGAEDFIDASLSDLAAEIISTVDQGMSGTLRWTPIEQLFRRTFMVVSAIAQRLAEEIAKNLEEKEKGRKEDIRRLFTEKSVKWRILAVLEDKGPMTSVQAASEVKVSQHTARKHLNSLVNEGYVECDRSSKPYIYRCVKTPW